MDLNIILALTTFFTAVLAPIVSLTIAKNQIKSAVVSKNRQDWIISLRNQVSELISDCQYLPNADIDRQLERKEVLVFHREILRKSNLIRLHLNMDEEFHSDFMQSIDDINEKILNHIRGNLFDYNEVSCMCNDVIEKCSYILKDEWIRVKSGD